MQKQEMIKMVSKYHWTAGDDRIAMGQPWLKLAVEVTLWKWSSRWRDSFAW